MSHPLLDALDLRSLDDAAEPASDAVLHRFEKDLGADLDPTYRELLSSTGPVYVREAAELPLPDGAGSTRLTTLFGLGCDRHWDLRSQTFDVYSGRIPDETIPIGEASGGNGDLILLAVEGPKRGEVFLWQHDHPEISSARLDQMTRDLIEAGSDVAPMDQAAIIHAWEHAHADELGRAPLWGNVVPVATSVTDLLRRTAGGGA